MNRVLIICSLFLIGCAGFDDVEVIDKIFQPDYVASSKAKKLEIPPDLSDMGDAESTYTVPGKATTYKDYKNRQNPEPKVAKIGIQPTDMKIVKSGTLRWLVVKKDRKILWTHVEDFWEDMGFEIRKSSKRTGIMETEWIKTSDLNRNKGGSLSRFDQWLDNMSGFADRRKFRTRVEPGQEPGTTEIYLSQRSARSGTMDHERILAERAGSSTTPRDKYALPEYITDDQNTEKIDISQERKLDDYEIDSELLTRLMVKLGASDLDAKKIVKNPTTQNHAEYITQNNESHVKLNDPFDRSWRRLTLALDIIGFITEDKNRSEGILYVKYKNTELPGGPKANDKGIIDTLAFWRDDDVDANEKLEKSKDKTKNIGKENREPRNKKGRSNKEDKFPEELEDNEVSEAEEVSELSEKDQFKESKKKEKDKAWIKRFSWGSDEENGLSKDERRYRVRILPLENGAKVYIDYPDGRVNKTSEAQRILKIIYEHLK